MNITDGAAHPLGSLCDAHGTNFAVFSSVAHRVDLCLFDASGNEQAVPLPGRSGTTWHGYVAGVPPGQRYGYRVHGPWNPAHGHLCCPRMLLLDPYARAVAGGVRWNDALFPYDPQSPAAAAEGVDSASFVPRSVVIDEAFDWRHDVPPRTPLTETLIYEVHVKGFTRRHPDIPRELRGTYAGLAHPVAIEHLLRLGVTAVELLPVQQFIHRRHLVASYRRNYWGYDPIAYFAPHNEYARADGPQGAVNEFKEMVRALHDAGIEIILDVVFNHTGEGGNDGPVLVFKGLDNAAYYRLHRGDTLRYVDVTGTQNTFNGERTEVRRLMIDALRYWVTEMHVDGFRFDLTPALVRDGAKVNMDSLFFEEIRHDPVLAGVKKIAEPWDLGEDSYRLGGFPADWSEWNDQYRDDVRDFWRGHVGATESFVRRFDGSADIFRDGGRSPQSSINFVTCHDGFTLADLVTYEIKHNEINDEDNLDGSDDNRAWNCGTEGPTKDAEINSLRARQKRNFMATLLLSRGVPMLLGGDELGRTQRGNNNAYCQDNERSWFDWESADDRYLAFVAFVARLRREHAVFRPVGWPSESAPGAINWFDAGGRVLADDDSADAPAAPIQALFRGSADAADFLLMLNPTRAAVRFAFPDGRHRWRLVFHTTDESPRPEAEVEQSYVVSANAAGLLTHPSAGP